MWYENHVFYHIYPLGFCGAPSENDEELKNRIQKVSEWIPHLLELGINAVYFGPVCESDRHGYDTRDYRKIDVRLGENKDFKEVCDELHEAGIKVIIDGVFNHVGRGFYGFQNVLKNRERSPYINWFHIDLNGNSNYNDGLWYEGWEGHFELVKLNLQNEEVISYLLETVKQWTDEFGIDGLRLDVAYMLDREFLKRLRNYVNDLKEEFFLLGEMIHGDYRQIVNSEMTHSCTNYECYKGLHSSVNERNLFEIAYSLNRQFGNESWTLYKGLHLINFVDNHDVNRIGSTLKCEEHLPLLYGLLFTIPGVPCIYYGSEWGALGEKEKGGDEALRLSYEKPEFNQLGKKIRQYADIYKEEKALQYGSYKQIYLTNQQYIFAREFEGVTIYVGINLSDEEHQAYAGEFNFNGTNLLKDNNGESVQYTGSLIMEGNSFFIWKVK